MELGVGRKKRNGVEKNKKKTVCGVWVEKEKE